MTSIKAFAQFDYSIKNFNTENGLLQNSIIGMTMDYDGFLWLATQNGLVRFDGVNFKTFLFDNTTKANRNDVRYIVNMPLDKKTLLGTGDGLTYMIEKGIPVWQKDVVRRPYVDILYGYFPDLSFYHRVNSVIQDHSNLVQQNTAVTNILQVDNNDFIAGHENKSLLLLYKKGIKTKNISAPANLGMFLKVKGYHFFKDDQSNLYLYDSSTYSFKKTELDMAALKLSGGSSDDIAFFPDPFSGQSWCASNSAFYSMDFDVAHNRMTFIPQFSIENKNHFWRGVLYDSLHSIFFLSTLTEGIFQVKLKRIKTISVNDKLPKNLEAGSIIHYTVLKTSDTTAVIPTGFKFAIVDSGVRVQKLGNILGRRETMAYLDDGAILTSQQHGLFYYSPEDGFRNKKVFNDSFNTYNSSASMMYREGDSIWISTNDAVLCLTKSSLRTAIQRKKMIQSIIVH